jgi:Domain of unknown function (DUF5668)
MAAMTDRESPSDPAEETQGHPMPGVILPPPGPASAGAVPAPAPGPLAGPDSAVPDEPEPAAEAAATAGVPPPTPPLVADPDRPTTDWREPPWLPPRSAHRDRGPSPAAIVTGLVLLAIGLYFFVDRTLGIDLPDISWGSLWPVILIAVGVVILVQAARRR